MADICNRDDIIDSRDLIEAINDLQDEQDSLVEEYRTAEVESTEADSEQCSERLASAINALCLFWGCYPEEVADGVEVLDDPRDAFNGHEELAAMKAFAAQVSDCGGFEHGAKLIRETYFKEYAEELARDLGLIPEDAGWPACHIDWEAAAESLQMDYSEGEFDGVTYFIRS